MTDFHNGFATAMNAFPLLAVLLALLAAGTAHAKSPTRPSRLGLCAACHGEHGIAVVPGVPHLAAQRYAYLLNAMQQYRDGRREVAVMRVALGPLSETQLKALAHWYAEQPAVQRHTGASP